MYGESWENDEDKSVDHENADIEADIKDEIEGMRSSTAKSLFQPIRIELKCGR